MSDSLKLSLDLDIHGDLLVMHADSLFGEARGESPMQLLNLVASSLRVDLRHIPADLVYGIGSTLYSSLFPGQVAKLLAFLLSEAVRARSRVEIEIRLDAHEVFLAKFPWEMLADQYGRLLVRDGLVDITRYIKFPQPKPALTIGQDDLLLQFISSPRNLPPISAHQLPVKHLKTIPAATFDDFTDHILVQHMPAWGIHFDGHGIMGWRCARCGAANSLANQGKCQNCGAALDPKNETGFVVFEKGNLADWVSARDFGAVLYNANIQFAMLLACETGFLGGDLIFNGMAPGLILAGVPAVIGMQYPVSDEFANQFSGSFYTFLEQERDIPRALSLARRINLQEPWYSPVLYLRHRHSDTPRQGIYKTRHIDTAVPAKAQAGVTFLAKLWIRRPESAPTPTEQLQRELGIKGEVATRSSEAELKFEPVEGRKLRWGEVEVSLYSPSCEIEPSKKRLFVSDEMDAPPAIFPVRPLQVGVVPLIFTLSQDSVEIAVITHQIEVDSQEVAAPLLEQHVELTVGAERSDTAPLPGISPPDAMVASKPAMSVPPPPEKGSVLRRYCPHCGNPMSLTARYCSQCGRSIDSPTYRPRASAPPASAPPLVGQPAPSVRASAPLPARSAGSTPPKSYKKSLLHPVILVVIPLLCLSIAVAVWWFLFNK